MTDHGYLGTGYLKHGQACIGSSEAASTPEPPWLSPGGSQAQGRSSPFPFRAASHRLAPLGSVPRTPKAVFAEAIAESISRLEKAKRDGLIEAYALIGGMAVSAWGIPRATRDLDFAVALGTADPRAVADALKGTFEPGGADDPLRGVFHVAIPTGDPAVPVQLVVFPPPWPPVLFEHVEYLSVLGCSVPVASWQTLLLLKLYAGGPADLLDAREIWRVCQPDPQAIRTVRELAERVSLAQQFDSFLESMAS